MISFARSKDELVRSWAAELLVNRYTEQSEEILYHMTYDRCDVLRLNAVDYEKLSESAFSFEQACNVRKQFIAHCIEEALFVQVELCGSDLIDVEGIILSYDGCTLEMSILSEDGVQAGHASVDAASVTRLFVPVSEQHIV